MEQDPLDLTRVFELEPHSPDTYLGESPPYPWGRIYGGLVIAQALWAATQTVRPEHRIHSLHSYFILGGELGEPVRYEVARLRNGRSFTTRQVVARQSAGAILSLICSFQADEDGPETQSALMPDDVPRPESIPPRWDAGIERCDVKLPGQSIARTWVRYPLPIGEDPRLQACALAYLSDTNAMDSIAFSHPDAPQSADAMSDDEWHEKIMGMSLDHALWFHRPVRAEDWALLELTGHGLIRTRGLASGPVFQGGRHVATIAQEGLLRMRRTGP